MNDYDKGYQAGIQNGSCRFDCRKKKINRAFTAGYEYGWDDCWAETLFRSDEAYEEWKNDQ